MQQTEFAFILVKYFVWPSMQALPQSSGLALLKIEVIGIPSHASLRNRGYFYR